MRIAINSGRRIAPHGLGRAGVGIRVVAERVHSFLTIEAVAAGNRERDDDAIAHLEPFDFVADFHDFAQLMAEDVAVHHAGYKSVIEVQIAESVTLTMASRGLRIFGSGTCSTLTWCLL